MHKVLRPLFLLGIPFLVLSSLLSESLAQTTISFMLTGMEADSLRLGYYLGEKQYIKETMPVDDDGLAVYSSDQTLESGIYLLVLPDNNYTEFLVDGSSFGMIYDATTRGTEYQGSAINDAFYDYTRFSKEMGDKRAALADSSAAMDPGEVAKQEEALGKEYEAFMSDFLTKNEGNLAGKVVSTIKEPIYPEGLSQFDLWQYAKKHFFDNYDLSESWLLRSPLLHTRIIGYMDQLTVQHHDSLTASVDYIAGMAENGDPEVYQYCMITLLNKYAESKLVVGDNVYFHIIDQYYLNGRAPWADAEMIQRFAERRGKLRGTLLGDIAQDITIEGSNGDTSKLHDIDANYLVLFFTLNDCEYCDAEIASFRKLYEEKHGEGFEILMINLSEDKERWRQKVQNMQIPWICANDGGYEYNTRKAFNVTNFPLVYVLDEKKEIIARKVNSESVRQILASEE